VEAEDRLMGLQLRGQKFSKATDEDPLKVYKGRDQNERRHRAY